MAISPSLRYIPKSGRAALEGIAARLGTEVSVAIEASKSPRIYAVPSFDEDAPPSAPHSHVVAIAIDAYADAALARQRDGLGARELRCDACDEVVEGEPAGRGILLTTRGAEVRFDEPVLCDRCATAIGLRAKRDFDIEDESD